MLDVTHYRHKNKHKVCINIQSFLCRELKRLSKKLNNEFLNYLYERHKRKILRVKIAPFKKTETTQYQPKQKAYKKMNLYISPSLWKKYKLLKDITGYSISYIIRVFLEWELQNEGQTITPLLPQIERDSDPAFSYEEYTTTHNYVLETAWRRQNQEIKLIFWDDN